MGEITEALRRARSEREGARRPPRERVRGVIAIAAGRPAAAVAPSFSQANAPAPAEPGAAVIRHPAAPLPRRGFEQPAANLELPRGRKGHWRARAVALEKPDAVADHFRQFAVRVGRELAKRRTNTLLVTSASSGEGRTTTAFNLALALASLTAGERVALVDLDLRRPGVAPVLAVRVKGGLEDVLAGRASLASVCCRTDFPALDVFPVGAPPNRAHELLVGRTLPSAVQELAGLYQVVVFDVPPVLPVPDVPLIAAHAGACVPLARSGVTRRAAFEAMLDQLPEDKLLGAFLNQAGGERVDRRYAS